MHENRETSVVPEPDDRHTGPCCLYAVGGSPSVAFLANSTDAVLADGVLGRVVLVRDPKGGAQIPQIWGASWRISQPVPVAVSENNHQALVAISEPAGVVSLSFAGESPVTLPCNRKVTGLECLAGSTAVSLNDPGEGPLWLLDASDSSRRLVFVPNSAPAFALAASGATGR